MTLSDLCEGICAVPPHAQAWAVEGLTADSHAVKPGFLFAALKGSRTDGSRFVPDAIAAGATAILGDTFPEFGPGDNVVYLVDEEPRRALALMAARFHAPQPDTMVAVTGTAGKTSVANFVRQIFAATGHRAASVGTVGVSIDDETRYGNLTTPDPVTLHRILAELAAEGVTHAAMEASSHGLDQHRLDGVRLVAAGFTNLGRDHLDYHPTMADYLAAKLRLFTTVLPEGRVAVVNADCPEAPEVVAAARVRKQDVLTVGRAGEALAITDIVAEDGRQIIALDGRYGVHRIALPLAGDFQVSNALVATGLAIGAGVPAADALAALETLKGAPGRLEYVASTPKGGRVYVDYAHKPDALAAVLAALRPVTADRLIVVFGAGGDRDPGKRPIMGEIAATGADVVIVTDDNPRSEDPATIRAAIMAAAPGATEIGDRGAAIAEAVAMAGAGDIVVVAGKGHEPGQIVGAEVLPFSDHDAVRAACGAGEAAS